jgi:hypothetical protein
LQQHFIESWLEDDGPIKLLFVEMATLATWYHQIQYLHSIGKLSIKPNDMSMSDFIFNISVYLSHHIQLHMPELRIRSYDELQSGSYRTDSHVIEAMIMETYIGQLRLRINTNTPELDELIRKVVAAPVQKFAIGLKTIDQLRQLVIYLAICLPYSVGNPRLVDDLLEMQSTGMIKLYLDDILNDYLDRDSVHRVMVDEFISGEHQS